MSGLTIVTNGVFDLFHNGHRLLLSKALKFSCGGELYVLVNTNKSTSNLKGKNRPIDPLEKRVQNIRNFTNFWRLKRQEYPNVYIDSFSTEEELRDKILLTIPDLLVKGNDYSDVTQITGHDLCPVVIIQRSNISTTQIIESSKM